MKNNMNIIKIDKIIHLETCLYITLLSSVLQFALYEIW